MKADRFYVYACYEPDSCEPFYIGKGTGFRIYRHIEPSTYNKIKTPLYFKIKSMLEAGTPPYFQKISEDLTESEAHLVEMRLINKFGRQDLGLGPLLNLTDGGEGSTYTRTPSHCKKLREAARRRKPLSEEAKRSIGDKNKMKMILNGKTKPLKGSLFGQILYSYQSINECRKDGFRPQVIQFAIKKRAGLVYGLLWEYI